MSKRVFLIVLDSFGVGALPDASFYGDEGSNTYGHILKSCPSLHLPNLEKLGLKHLIGKGERDVDKDAAYGRMIEHSKGKDTTTGHWELAGITLDKPFPTFPNGFPEEFIRRFEQVTGYGTLGNKAASGTAILDELGAEHLATGKLIVYTSADSVFQIAAHEKVVPVETLYAICKQAREMLTGELAVGRVIARPFTGEPGAFTRLPLRHDYSLAPVKETVLDVLHAAGKDVIGVGKIGDIFAGRGLTQSLPTHGNTEGIEVLLTLAKRDFDGLAFVNLVDFDMLYGHRRDPDGYAKALEEFDACLPELIGALSENDLLMITADHGCDPTFKGTDHTREAVPMLQYGKALKHKGELGQIDGFAFAAEQALAWLL